MPSDGYTCTKFGVDSSGRFPVRARTNRQTDRQTDATERPTHASVGNKHTAHGDVMEYHYDIGLVSYACVVYVGL